MDTRKILSRLGKMTILLMIPLIGFVCGKIMGGSIARTKTPFVMIMDIIRFLVILYILIFLQIIIHETGHLICGLLSGYTFSSFRILSFMWSNENGKIHFKRYKLNIAAGQCLMLPPALDENNQLPYLLYNLGGVFFNILSSLLVLPLFLISTTPLFKMCCFIFIAIGVVFAYVNGIPACLHGINNDGMNACALKHPEAPRAFWINLMVADKMTKGERLKDMPSSWFRCPSQEAMKNGMVAILGVYACARLLDEHHYEEANTLIEELLSIKSGIVPLHRKQLIVEQYFIKLIKHQTLTKENIDQLFKMKNQLQNDPAYLRVLYAYHLLQNKNIEKVDWIKKRFEKIISSYPYQAEASHEQELLQMIDQLS